METNNNAAEVPRTGEPNARRIYYNRVKIAKWRFDQIKSAVDGGLTRKDRAEAIQEASAKPVRWPSGFVRAISCSTLYRWCFRYKSGGVDALLPKPRIGQNSLRHQNKKRIVEQAITLLRKDPSQTISVLAARLECCLDGRQNGQTRIPKSTLHNWLAIHPDYRSLIALKKHCPTRRILAHELEILTRWRKSNNKKLWQKATILLDCQNGDLRKLIGKVEVGLATAYRWIRSFNRDGLEALSPHESVKRRTHSKKARNDQERIRRLLEILHEQPSVFGINRSNWTQQSLAVAYADQHGEPISKSTVGRSIRAAGYRWRKAKRVLTSPDPHYREKVELLLDTLQSLKLDEMFFFVDELGPIRVKRYGGRCYVPKDTTPTVPQRQTYRGSITMAGALNATTNQMSWTFEESKQTGTMIDLIEILFNQYYEKSRLFVTWDAASWHRSNELLVWLDAFNSETSRVGEGPIIELIPLPSSAQFLDVIEAVFSAMKRAVLHHSDYKTELDMKSAISVHFRDRNDYFTENPLRAGKKIWEIDFFSDFKNIKAGDYREW